MYQNELIHPECENGLNKKENGKYSNLLYTLNPKKKNYLLLPDGNKMRAKMLEWDFTEINWTPGGGSPNFNEACPGNQNKPDPQNPDEFDFYSFNVKKYQIIESFGGKEWDVCGFPTQKTGDISSEVYFIVNDRNGLYEDNHGIIKVKIIQYSE